MLKHTLEASPKSLNALSAWSTAVLHLQETVSKWSVSRLATVNPGEISQDLMIYISRPEDSKEVYIAGEIFGQVKV